LGSVKTKKTLRVKDCIKSFLELTTKAQIYLTES